ncbi:hypothetical protein D5086_000645 [Populus alba]|uniref:Uncharacterized protein n=1 Tax=Populus alba TaxID=43335 RepID=A0ACC4CXK6_POPAL
MSPKTAQIRLVSSHPEVYEPCDDSFALVDALLADRTNILDHCPRLCLEVGCGSGYVIASLALMLGQELPGVYYFATDINPHALRVTRETLDAHAVDAELMCMDIASGLEKRLAGMVDVMVVNPPYVPTPDYEVGREGIASAWAGGENGRSVIDRILPVADRLLSDKGWLYMVTLTTNDPSQICLLMRKRGYASRIVVQRSTEEESLHIIKFWRDSDIQLDTKEILTTNKSVPARVKDSLVSQFSQLSFWRDKEIRIEWDLLSEILSSILIGGNKQQSNRKQVDKVAGNLTFETTIFALEGYNTSSQSTLRSSFRRRRVRTAAEDHSIQITAFMELERTESPRTLNPFSFQERAPGAQGIELFVTWRLGLVLKDWNKQIPDYFFRNI